MPISFSIFGWQTDIVLLFLYINFIKPYTTLSLPKLLESYLESKALYILLLRTKGKLENQDC